MTTSIENVLLIINLVSVAQKTLAHLPYDDRHPFRFDSTRSIEYLQKYILIEYDLKYEQLEIHNKKEASEYISSKRGINIDVSMTIHFKDANEMNKYKLKNPRLYQKLKGDSWTTMFVNPDYIN